MNNRILEGNNPYMKIKNGGEDWTLTYKKINSKLNPSFYEQLQQISIIDLVKFVDIQSGFLRSFTHINPKHQNSNSDNNKIIASIIANGTGQGIYKMSNSSDISYHQLIYAEKNFIRLETLRSANDTICDAISNLLIYSYLNIEETETYSSLDGQKYETTYDNFLARYSPKYFGLNKGVVSYSLVTNHIPVNARIIGANEYEGWYVFESTAPPQADGVC